MPDADIEFRPLLENYPSAWDALGLEPVTIPMGTGSWGLLAPDLSILAVEAREAGGARIVRTELGGTAHPLTDWLPTDRGQQWGPLEFSDPWLVYADSAGSHVDGPITEPGLFLANIDTGEVVVLEQRDFGAPVVPCDECGDWMFFTSARISDSTVYWIDGGPGATVFDRVLSSRPLSGGPTSKRLTGAFLFDDASCVTTPGADIRVSGDQGYDDVSGTATLLVVWDVPPVGDPVLVSPEGGMVGGAGNTEPSTCAGTDIVGWYTPLDGSPLADSMSGSEGDPLTLLNAIDVVRPDSRARIRIDHDFQFARPVSYAAGWVVVQLPSVEPLPYRYILLDTVTWSLYEIDAPAGAAVDYAGIREGLLWATLDTTLDEDWLNADSVLTAPLP